MVMRALLRAVLYLTPGEFRRDYAAQIGASYESVVRASDIVDLAVTGIGLRWEDFARDLTYALRRLTNAPLFVGTVLLTFALGIGANVAVFSVLNAVVLRPLPFIDATDIVIINGSGPGQPVPSSHLSIADVLDARAARTLSATAATTQDKGTLLVRGRPFTISGMEVTPEYFSILGITPELGRIFVPRDSDPGVRNIIISDALWRNRLSSDPAVIGRSITVSGTSYHVVGVLKAQQASLDPHNGFFVQDYYVALPERATVQDRRQRFMGGIARLAPGATIAHANAELALVSARLRKLYPQQNHGWALSVSPSAALLGTARSALWLIFIAVIGILLIACANVGNLLGAHWSTRDRELAVRRALGASSRRIAAQLFVETGVLAAVGAIVGVSLADGGLHVIGGLLNDALPRASAVAIDGASLLYALLAVVAATVIAGLAPILSLRVTDLQTALKSGGRGGDASAHHRSRSALAIVEIALALALVVIAGLTVRNFIDLLNTPLGIRPNGVITSDIATLPDKNDDTIETRATTQQQVLTRLRALPGVSSAALAVEYPLGDVAIRTSAPVFGRTFPLGAEPHAWANDVSSDYFRTLGISLLKGRVFADSDTINAPPVTIVNQAFATRFLDGMNPIGVRIRTDSWNGTQTHWAKVVGVVANERDRIGEPFQPEFYVPLAQSPPAFFSAVVYAPGLNAATAGREIQEAYAAAMPLLQPPATYTIEQRITDDTSQARLTTLLLGTLALLALILALSGIFGVVSFSVTQRSREFGVRIALGATAGMIMADVLRRTLTTTAIGVAIGVIIAALGAHAIASQLGTISPFDPTTFATVVVLIFVSAALASLHPAMRAMHVQPVEALRYE